LWQGGGPEEKQTDCSLIMRKSREMKLKKLKHEEGHIALGE
jgi:hypothetical protein